MNNIVASNERQGEAVAMKDMSPVMKKYFGFSEFKPGQKEIVESILQSRDTLAVLPTGGGKSLCYQLPALIMSGTVLVISPLIALMKDQVDALQLQGIPASFINSSLTASEVRARMFQASRGQYRLLYVAPERLQTDQFDSLLQELPLSLVAIDEAHCISQWGHDFRPSYLGIRSWVETLPQRPPLAAFTATATARVREDIIQGLGMKQAQVFLNSFDRPNLCFAVVKSGDRSRFVRRYLEEHPTHSGIVYAATRKEVDRLHEEWSKLGVKCGKYHAGLSTQERTFSQEDFIHDRIQVMVATNAFGLGIDKSNVRFVIHHNMPRHLEAYYQEAGRAGRDGEDADCILFYQAADIQVQKTLIEQSVLSENRKKIEYAKLQDMVDYCHTSRCLRSYILEYFGENFPIENCGSCSNCNEYEERDITIEAQKILSCIYRMRQRFGSSLIAAVLQGSKQKRVKELGFDQLSTYGIMSDLKTGQIVELINLLVAEEYLTVVGGQYPVVRLTARVAPVLRGQEKVLVRMMPVPERLVPEDEIFQALRALRQQIAGQEQVPPYVVFADSTLREMGIKLPLDREAMLEITGVGEIKFERYGRQFLELIHQYAQSTDGLDKPAQEEMPEKRRRKRKDKEPPAPREEKIPTHIVSWQLYREGVSLQEIARQRERTLITIQNHLLQAAREGHEVDWSQFITPQQEQLILHAVSEIGVERLRPIKETLPEDIDYFAIKIAIVKNGLEQTRGTVRDL